MRLTIILVFTLALLQMRVIPGEKARNLQHAGELALAAARQGAEVILLPETLTLGWTHPSAKTEADVVGQGESCQAFARIARETKTYVCAGFVERSGELLFNSAALFDPEGRVLLHHRKINELDFARDLYALGDRVGVVQTPLGKLGLMICADAFVEGQAISRTLGHMGAQCILSPCAWAVPADHDNAREPYGKLWLDNYGPVCRDHQLTIAGCSNVGPILTGPWAGRKCIGCSLVLDARGEILAQGPYGGDAEAVLLARVTS